MKTGCNLSLWLPLLDLSLSLMLRLLSLSLCLCQFLSLSLSFCLCLSLSPWYNCSGWLGVKHQVTLSLSHLSFSCFNFSLSLSQAPGSISSFPLLPPPPPPPSLSPPPPTPHPHIRPCTSGKWVRPSQSFRFFDGFVWKRVGSGRCMEELLESSPPKGCYRRQEVVVLAQVPVLLTVHPQHRQGPGERNDTAAAAVYSRFSIEQSRLSSVQVNNSVCLSVCLSLPPPPPFDITILVDWA